jgi:hypothetical protein
MGYPMTRYPSDLAAEYEKTSGSTFKMIPIDRPIKPKYNARCFLFIRNLRKDVMTVLSLWLWIVRMPSLTNIITLVLEALASHILHPYGIIVAGLIL